MADNGTQQEAVGQVVVAHGEVFLETSSGLVPLVEGSSVYHDSVVVTEDGGQVEIKFNDGTVLSQGANSRMTVDDYVFDDGGSSPASLLFEMGQGAFRVITGKIAEQNPENFNVKTPLATIGIRGTDFSVETGPDGDLVLVGKISENHILVVEDQFGSVRFVNYSGMEVVVEETAGIQEVRRATPEEVDRIQANLPVTSFIPTDSGDDGSNGHDAQGDGVYDGGDDGPDGDGVTGDHNGNHYNLFQYDDPDLFHTSFSQDGDGLHSPFGDQGGDDGLVSLYGQDEARPEEVLVQAEDELLVSRPEPGLVIAGGEQDDILSGRAGDDLITGGGGDDQLSGGDGDDVISGGAGADHIQAGGGDDTLVVWGAFSQDYYSGFDAAHGDLSLGSNLSQLVSGEVLDGGSGRDTLVTYGTTDYSGATLSDIEVVEMHSDTTFGAGQLGGAGVEIIRGDGGAILRFTGNGPVDLSAIDTSGISTIEIGPGVTLLVSQANLDGLQSIIGSGHLMPGPGVTTLDLSGIDIAGAIDTFENDAPFGITLTSTEVVENVMGAAVGTLAALDPDAGDTHSFTLLSGGDYFEIVGDHLQLKSTVQLDYENPPGDLSVTVQVADALGATHVESFDISIADTNDPPTDIVIDSNVVAENEAGAVVGQLDAVDQNPGDSHQFSIISGGDDFEIVGDHLQLKDGVSLDYENPPGDLDIVVEATDPFGATVQQTVTVEVSDQNDAPTGIVLSQQSVEENVAGAVVGLLGAVDQDANDSHTFSLISGGDDFEIVGNQLKLHDGVSLDYENPPHDLDLVIGVTDAAGATVQQSFTVELLDANDSPVAADDHGSTLASSPVTIDVLANDADVDPGDILTVSGVNGAAAAGTVVVNADHTITYDPGGEYDFLPYGATAQDTFSYTVSDGHGGIDTAEVTVTITGQASPPPPPVSTVIMGTPGPDTLTGGSGAETIIGLAGNDFLVGGAGHDSLDAGPGNDFLAGGPGNDVLIGGAGTDVFTFMELGPGNADQIADFHSTYSTSPDFISLGSPLSNGLTFVPSGTLHTGSVSIVGFTASFTTTWTTTTTTTSVTINGTITNTHTNINTSTVTLSVDLTGIQQYVHGPSVNPGVYSNPQSFSTYISFPLHPSATMVPVTLHGNHPYIAYNSVDGHLYYDPDGGLLNTGVTIATLSTAGGGHPTGTALGMHIVSGPGVGGFVGGF